MSTPDDPSLWVKLATGAATIAAALAAVVWGDVKSRVKDVEEGLFKKADRDEMNRQRDNITELFTKVDEQTRRTEDRFDKVTTLMHELHREIMGALDRKQDKRR